LQIADAAIRPVTGADHNIELPLLDRCQHLWEERLVVLNIGVHHRDERSRARENTFDAGRGQAATPEPLNAADIALLLSEFRTRSVVPSGESSSTKTASHRMPDNAPSSRSTSAATFARSFKVGMTTASSTGNSLRPQNATSFMPNPSPSRDGTASMTGKSFSNLYR
jgi:hypothetical protein